MRSHASSLLRCASCVVGIVLAAAASSAWAEPAGGAPPSTAASVPSPRRYVFLGNERYPPLVYKEGGRVLGVSVDLANAAIAKARLDAEVRATEWADAQREVRRGAADALVQINRNPERELLYDFSEPLLESEFCFFRKQVRADIAGVESLRGRVVAVEAGGYTTLLMQRFPEVGLQTVTDLQVGFRLLDEGAVDALITERWAGEFALARSKIRGIRVVEPAVEQTVSYIAVRKGNRELLSAIDEGLRGIRADGTRQRILERWRGNQVVYLSEQEFAWYRVALGLGAVAFVLAVVVYVDARRLARAKRLLADEVRRSRAVLEDLPIPVACTTLDAEGRVVFVNTRFVETFGHSAADVPTLRAWAAKAEEAGVERSELLALREASRAGASPTATSSASRELALTTKDGRLLTVLASVSVSGDLLIASFLDLTERKRLEASVRDLAFRDPLTHLANRRLLEEHLAQAMATSRRTGRCGALLVIDLDNFKPLNDTFGHDAGDELLVEVATRLTRTVRQSDVVSRYGGDEFVVVLSGLDADEAGALGTAGRVAEKVLEVLSAPYALKTPASEAGVVEHRCTASFGVALFGRGGETRDQVFRRADGAMYRAKKAGRNQVRFHEPGAPDPGPPSSE